MKKFTKFIVAFISLGNIYANACNVKTDPKKVMLFVDTNNSEQEIETTKKAACSRGMRLMVVPKNYLEYGKINTAIEVSKKNYEHLYCSDPKKAGCEEAKQKLDKALSERDIFLKKSPDVLNIEEGLKIILEKEYKINWRNES